MMGDIGGMIQSAVREAPMKRRILKHSTEMNQNYDVNLGKLLEIGMTNSEILSYLWLAIDSGLNILIVGPEFSGKKQLLFALAPLIPKHEKVLVFGNGTKGSKYYINFVSFVSDGKVTGKHIASSKQHNASRIILDRIRGPEARELFSCANYGIPFLTTFDFCSECGRITDVLKGKPTNVAENTINMLDVIISMRSGPSTIWKIDSIEEIRWLSRVEIWPEEAKTLKDFHFKVTRIAENGKLTGSTLKGSKVFQNYSDINLLSKEEVLKELNKRAKFLEGIQSSELPVLEYVRSFFEINQDGQGTPLGRKRK